MEITSFIICEDIRREIGNKTSLMGILNEEISYDAKEASVWPKAMNLATFIRLSAGEGDQLPSNFLFSVTLEGEEVANIAGEISVAAGIRIVNIPITMYGFPLKSAGLLVFKFKALHQEVVLIEAESNLRISEK